MNDKVLKYCLEKSNYRVYRTLTGDSHLTALMRFTLAKNAKDVARNIAANNAIIRSMK